MQLATQQKWTAYIEQQQKSILTIEQFCKQLSVLPNTRSSFIKATVTQQLEIETTCAPILLTLGKINLSLPPPNPCRLYRLTH
ncbi:MAG: hypothetical protein JKX76_07605 [Colwellia sp.]|nr:hypothetical protein [Colwellia sp.]